jgi:hypothetical protein
MTRTKLDDLHKPTTRDELLELSDEQLAQVCGGNGGTNATNVVTGGGDGGGGGGVPPHKMI